MDVVRRDKTHHPVRSSCFNKLGGRPERSAVATSLSARHGFAARLPVEPLPCRAVSAETPPVPDSPPGDTFTVRRLCDRVSAVLSDSFPDQIWVQGAISGLTRSNNGHVYFDLVDPDDTMGRSPQAVLPVALFSSSRQLVNRIMRRSGGIRMHDGVEIRIRGQLAYYPPQGRVQLVMSLIDPQFTLGQMAAARQALLDRLSEEGLLDRNLGRPFPALPLRIGLVTSDQSAAYHDFVEQLTTSGYPFSITLIDSRVQGVDAVPSLAAALGAAAGPELDVDVMVVVRGGGARTDLAVFDHEDVARAIARCPVPVIVGVGHETDRSVADEVAHTSVKTPTAAAQALIESVALFDARLDDAAQRIGAITGLHLRRATDQLMGCGSRLASSAQRAVERQRAAVDQATFRLGRAPQRLLERAATELDLADVRLRANDPTAALRRGWTITYVETGDGKADGPAAGATTLLRRADQVTVGDTIRTVTADGELTSAVTATAQTDPEREAGD